jgi:hypothetical protein
VARNISSALDAVPGRIQRLSCAALHHHGMNLEPVGDEALKLERSIVHFSTSGTLSLLSPPSVSVGRAEFVTAYRVVGLAEEAASRECGAV